MGILFGTDGIRDKADHGWLTVENVKRLGAITGYLLRTKNESRFSNRSPIEIERERVFFNRDTPPRVVIGRDTRESSQRIEQNLATGLLAQGAKATRAGVLTTPALANLARTYHLGIMITASHNSYHDNGIKYISTEGLKIPDHAEALIEKYFLDKTFQPMLPPKKRQRVPYTDTPQFYEQALIERFHKLGTLENFSVVLDCANGAAYELAPRVFQYLGLRTIILANHPNGRNINHRCGAMYPEKLVQAVRRHKADLGVALDGDGDRAILVDEKGIVRDGDYVLAICAEWLKKKRLLTANTVVSTVMANFGLEKYLAERKIRLIRTAVGDRYVCAEMLRRGALLGGEPSGHIIFFDQETTGDGLVTALRVLEVIADEQKTLYELSRKLVKFPQVLINVPVKEKPPLEKVKPVRQIVDKVQKCLDHKGHLVLRYSGTEPLARVMVEGTNAKHVKQWAQQIAWAIQSTIGV